MVFITRRVFLKLCALFPFVRHAIAIEPEPVQPVENDGGQWAMPLSFPAYFAPAAQPVEKPNSISIRFFRVSHLLERLFGGIK